MKTLIVCTPLLLCLAIGQAFAGTPIRLSHPATPGAHIEVANVSGAVHVTAWDRPLVEIGGELGSGAKPLAITGTDARLAIKVEPQGGGGWFNWGGRDHMGPTTLDLRVPRGASLDVQVVSAPLSIDGTAGGTIKVSTVSGRARINARTPQLTVHSVSGTIEFAGSATRADLQTVSGDILAPVISQQAKLQTVSGHVQVGGGPWRELTLSTVSGDAQLAGSLAPGGNITVDSMSGNVQLQLPATTSATLHARTFSGDLRSSFGTGASGEAGGRRALDAQIGAGAGSIKLETFSGDLRIRRAD